ncbi:PAQR9 isoform 3, partial [Pan troglodytes]
VIRKFLNSSEFCSKKFCQGDKSWKIGLERKAAEGSLLC